MEKKTCTKCNTEKELEEYYKQKGRYRAICKKCMDIKNRLYREKNHEILKEKNKSYNEKNSEKNKIRCFNYRQNNPGSFKNWVAKNKEHRRAYINKYNTDPYVKIKNSLRARINELMNKKNQNENPRTFDLIGCDFDFFVSYIENKFTEGMVWDNYGFYGWHLDHKIPLCSAKTEDEIKKLFHYTNLQPLWWMDNFKKGGKII